MAVGVCIRLAGVFMILLIMANCYHYTDSGEHAHNCGGVRVTLVMIMVSMSMNVANIML